MIKGITLDPSRFLLLLFCFILFFVVVVFVLLCFFMFFCFSFFDKKEWAKIWLTSLRICKSAVLPYFSYCGLTWHFCRKLGRNKLERINERGLKGVFDDRSSTDRVCPSCVKYYGAIYLCCKFTYWISLFRVVPSLRFKARLSAKLFIWNQLFILMQKTHFALSLVLRVRVFGTRRCPIRLHFILSHNIFTKVGRYNYYMSLCLGFMNYL